MKSLNQLRAAADKNKSAFLASMTDVKSQLKPDALFETAVHSVDPDFAILKRMEDRIKGNPFAVMAALAGLYLLVRQLTTTAPVRAPQTSNRGRRSRLFRTTAKGDHHGHIDNTKHT